MKIIKIMLAALETVQFGSMKKEGLKKLSCKNFLRKKSTKILEKGKGSSERGIKWFESLSRRDAHEREGKSVS